MTSASSIVKPWSSAAVRQGVVPTAQSTSAMAPHDRHTTWWWLSPTRASYRATESFGWMRRTRPTAVSTRRTSYTAWWETSPRSARTTPMIESVSACGWSCTADSTATRGRVTRRATPRNMTSKSDVVGTLRSLAHFLESIKYQLVGHLDDTRRAVDRDQLPV